jgi:hypothetical protein
MVVGDQMEQWQLHRLYGTTVSAKIMEAEAICDATKICIEQGYQNVHIESYAQEVVNLLKDPQYCSVRYC